MEKMNNKGISLIILVITVIVISIIASIAIYYGTETIKKANVETIRTNMLLIKAKANEYCEEANFKLGTSRAPKLEEGQEETDEFRQKLAQYLEPGIKYLENKNSETGEKEDPKRPAFARDNGHSNIAPSINGQFVTQLDDSNAQIMGVKGVENIDKYLIRFDIIENKVEIYYLDGVKDDNDMTKYSLTEIEQI